MTADDASGKIAMTAPVAVHAAGKIAMTVPVRRRVTDERLRMLFFMPSTLSRTTAPRPTDPRVKLIMMPRWKRLRSYVSRAPLTATEHMRRN
jgi:hypothetical protein